VRLRVGLGGLGQLARLEIDPAGPGRPAAIRNHAAPTLPTAAGELLAAAHAHGHPSELMLNALKLIGVGVLVCAGVVCGRGGRREGIALCGWAVGCLVQACSLRGS
jgi:hypothetical protein